MTASIWRGCGCVETKLWKPFGLNGSVEQKLNLVLLTYLIWKMLMFTFHWKGEHEESLTWATACVCVCAHFAFDGAPLRPEPRGNGLWASGSASLLIAADRRGSSLMDTNQPSVFLLPEAWNASQQAASNDTILASQKMLLHRYVCHYPKKASHH